jgi:hypothetical protein
MRSKGWVAARTIGTVTVVAMLAGTSDTALGLPKGLKARPYLRGLNFPVDLAWVLVPRRSSSRRRRPARCGSSRRDVC